MEFVACDNLSSKEEQKRAEKTIGHYWWYMLSWAGWLSNVTKFCVAKFQYNKMVGVRR